MFTIIYIQLEVDITWLKKLRKMNYNNIVNASTGYTREERVMGYHYEYKTRLIKGYALEDFSNDEQAYG